MTLLFDRHRPIVSPALVPADPRDFDKVGGDRNAADRVLTVGLINNMPDAALQATERQFMRLLTAAAGENRIRLHCFSLPSVKRSQSAQWRIEQQYTDIAEIDRLSVDGLIVTGAEPNAATLRQESFWHDLIEIVDWAKTNTRSTIWSCLAAHAAVLHLDGVERRRLVSKCSGFYETFKVSSHWLTDDLNQPFAVAHSRLNELSAGELAANGYQLLTHSPEAGVDIFAKRFGSHFVFFQGHPEYEALSLEREYLRDVSRFLAGERDSCPAVPPGYFDTETEQRLADFAKRARIERRPELSSELPDRTLRHNAATREVATAIFRNWLGFLAGGAPAALPRLNLVKS
jgi:homoserine O-succinyltransferase